jgi:hypothetical protein
VPQIPLVPTELDPWVGRREAPPNSGRVVQGSIVDNKHTNVDSRLGQNAIDTLLEKMCVVVTWDYNINAAHVICLTSIVKPFIPVREVARLVAGSGTIRLSGSRS